MLQETFAGYRLLRKLGSGSRAEVHLGYAGSAPSGGFAQSDGQPPTRTAALKLFYPTASAESVDTEIRALTEAEHAHIVQLRDLSRAGDGRPVLVLERLEPWSLGQVLASRTVFDAGEIVTVLAPLAAAVAALHQSGFAHGAITPSRLLFRQSGAPVLSGFGHATALTPQSAELDNRHVAALAAVVLERVPSADGLRAWLAAQAAHPEAFLARLSERLFDFASATPVRFAPDGARAESVPARAAWSTEAAPGVLAGAGLGEPAHVDAAAGKRAALSNLAVRLGGFAAPYLVRIPPRFRRPRYAALAAGALALVVALAAVPSDGGTVAELTPSAVPATLEAGPVAGDDPVAAFDELVRLRNRCIRDLSVLCLDTVLQPSSAAMEHDTALIRSIERGEGGEAELRPGRTQLVERLGDAALVSFILPSQSEPASALLVRGEAGWRIRSYLAG